MNPQPDAKRDTIVSILFELRTFNPQIGNYVRSSLHTNFNYAVTLDNGSIELPANLVNDYEQDADYITEERFRGAAERFRPDKQHMPKDASPVTENTIGAKGRRFVFFILLILAIVFILTLIL